MLEKTNKMELNIDQTFNRLAEYRKLKLRLRNVLQCYKYCAVCLDTVNLSSSAENITIPHWEGNYVTTMQAILDTVFSDQKLTPQGMDICESCRGNAITSFIFIKSSKRTIEILEEYLDQLYRRIDEVVHITESSHDKDITNGVIVLDDPIKTVKDDGDDTLQASDDEAVKVKPKNGSNHHFICEYCEKVFISKQGMSYHISKIHKKCFARKHLPKRVVKKYIKKFDCPDCERNDCEHKRYMQHYEKQRQAGLKLIKCIDCNYVCNLKPTLIAHVNKVHLKTFMFVCEQCGKPLHSKLAYKMHNKNFHTLYHNCQYCERPFKFVQNLDIHQNKCKDIQRQFECASCPASFDTKSKLHRHEKKHIERFPCNQCNKVLTSAKNLKTHKEMHNSNKRMKMQYSYRCPICNKNFTNSTERDIHSRKHKLHEKPACLGCNIIFETVQEYTKHTQTSIQHVQKKGQRTSYSCNFCNYSTLAEFNLEAHVNRHHLKIAPYKCDTCEKKFTNQVKLTGHMNTHKGLITHHCELCGRGFRGSAAVRKHTRLHTGEKPYSCEICGEGFISTTVKKMHPLKKHSEKTVACPLCDGMFYTLPLMRGHFKRVHWKVKGVKFDVTKVEGLKEEHYDLFRDRRFLTLDE